MTRYLAPNLQQKLTDSNNRPISGGAVHFYVAGSFVRATTYSAEEGSPNPNPIITSAEGSYTAFLDPAVMYDVYGYDSLGALIFTKLRVGVGAGTGTTGNYITTNTDQLNLSGSKKTTGAWEFANTLIVRGAASFDSAIDVQGSTAIYAELWANSFKSGGQKNTPAVQITTAGKVKLDGSQIGSTGSPTAIYGKNSNGELVECTSIESVGSGSFITKTTDQTGLSGSKETIGTWTFDASAKSLASETVFRVKKDASNNWLRMRGDGFLAVQKLTNAYGEFGDSIVGNTFSCLGRAFFDTNGVDYNAAISVGHGNVTAGWIITQTGGWDGAGTYASAGTFNGQPYYSFGSYKLFAAQVGAVWYWFINATLIADGPTAYISATARQLSGGDIATWLPSSQTFYLQNGAQTGQTASATYETGGGLLGISTTTIDARNGMKISGDWADGNTITINKATGRIRNLWGGVQFGPSLDWDGPNFYVTGTFGQKLGMEGSAGLTYRDSAGNVQFKLRDATTSGITTLGSIEVVSSVAAVSLSASSLLSLSSSASINYNATTKHFWDSGISGSTAKYQFNGQVHALSYGMTNALSALTPNTDTSSRIQAGVQDNTVSSLSDGGTKARVIHVQAGVSSDGYSHQLGLTDNGNMWMRSGASGGTTWGAWKKVWSENNFDPTTKANLSGASFTGDVNATTQAVIGATNGGQVLSLKPGASADHCYMAFYARSASSGARSAYVGYASGGTNTFTFDNSLGGFQFNQALSGTSASFSGDIKTNTTCIVDTSAGSSNAWFSAKSATGTGVSCGFLMYKSGNLKQYIYCSDNADSLKANDSFSTWLEVLQGGAVNINRQVIASGQVSTSKAFVSGSNGLSTVTGATANVDISAYGVWYHANQLTGAVTLNMNAGAQAGLVVRLRLQQATTAVSYTLAYSGVWFELTGTTTQVQNSLTIPTSKFINSGIHMIVIQFFTNTFATVSVI